MSARDIGLFPLAAALVPGELMPLHIFEDRYKDLLTDCLDGEHEFVLLYADDDGAREIGCTARVVDVLERFDDGRMDVVVEGSEVVRVVEMTRGHSYMTGLVEPADDDPAAGDEATSALALYRQIAEATGATADADVTLDSRPVSYAITARVEFPVAEKQRILELRTERERLMVVIDLLARGLQSLARSAEIHRRAATNGKVVPPQ